MTETYTIRPGFTIVINDLIFVGGDGVDLTPEQFEQHKHKLEGVESNVLPINSEQHTFNSELSPIAFATPIVFTHGFDNLDLLTECCLVDVYLVCKVARGGYQPGDIVTPETKIACLVDESTITCLISSNGIKVTRTDNFRPMRINVDNWDLMVKAAVA